MSKSQIIVFTVLLSALSTLSACTDQKLTQSGFINDYSKLQEVSGSENDDRGKEKIYRNPNFDAANYFRVVISPVLVSAKSDDEDQRKQYDALGHLIEKKLSDNFSKKLQVVTQPEANTLLVRTSITGVTESSPIANVATTALIAAPLLNGGLSVEAEVLDAATGERLIAITWANEGSIWRWDQITGSFSRYEHAEYLAGVFVDKLVQLTESKSPEHQVKQ